MTTPLEAIAKLANLIETLGSKRVSLEQTLAQKTETLETMRKELEAARMERDSAVRRAMTAESNIKKLEDVIPATTQSQDVGGIQGGGGSRGAGGFQGGKEVVGFSRGGHHDESSPEQQSEQPRVCFYKPHEKEERFPCIQGQACLGDPDRYDITNGHMSVTEEDQYPWGGQGDSKSNRKTREKARKLRARVKKLCAKCFAAAEPSKHPVGYLTDYELRTQQDKL